MPSYLVLFYGKKNKKRLSLHLVEVIQEREFT